MAHEELQEQYEEDKQKYGKDAYRLWEFKSQRDPDWQDCDPCGPRWYGAHDYRREEPPFQPKYYSGLNWREALEKGLVGKNVELSNTGGNDWVRGRLVEIISDEDETHRFKTMMGLLYIYIRTSPETHAHPTVTLTVNGREWVLPKPETEAPERGTKYYKWMPHRIECHAWYDDPVERCWFDSGEIHLTEASAQAWSDFWQEAILGMRG